MNALKNAFSSRAGMIGTGMFIGVVAVGLQKMGNPANMGICVACFARDISGSLGLHRADIVQYLRPEILGFVLGSFVAAVIFREFRPRAGSAPMIRFILGAFAMIGALVFLGCPWRAMLRLSGGDWNALFGIAGLVGGIWVGSLFLKSGYDLGRSQKTHMAAGLALPFISAGFLLLMLIFPQIPGKGQSGILFYSVTGPGSMHAPFIFSLGAGLVIGFVAQRSRFCTMGAIRDLILFRQTHLLSGILALVVAAFVLNLVLGQFKPGFQNQPIAHTMGLWNFGGMVLAGLAFALAGGCPGRQVFMAGEGDGDAAVFVLGMIAGAAFSHNFGLASSTKGVGPHGITAVLIGLAACLLIGFAMTRRTA
jgi:YedE family putative selenium metabolism protein